MPCHTVQGPQPNKQCKFPFKYKENNGTVRTFHRCIPYHDDQYWCPTEGWNEEKQDMNSTGGICNNNCPRHDEGTKIILNKLYT